MNVKVLMFSADFLHGSQFGSSIPKVVGHESGGHGTPTRLERATINVLFQSRGLWDSYPDTPPHLLPLVYEE
jgi:hypothetical protein